MFTQQTSVPSNTLLASLMVEYSVVKWKEPHIIAEELTLPAALDVTKIMVRESLGKPINREKES